MRYPTEMRVATVISAPEFALALSDISDADKQKAGIAGLDMPTLTTAVADAARGQKILKELGYGGAYYVKSFEDTQYVIIKGVPSLRPYLTGTRYLATNPKVVRVGLGPIAQNSALKANFILAMTMYTAADIAAMVVGDQMTFSRLMGNAIFNAASTLASSMASTLVAGMFTLAAPSILGGIVAGVAVSVLFNTLNEELKISELLAQLLEDTADAFNDERVPPDKVVRSMCSPAAITAGLSDLEDCLKLNKPGGAQGGAGQGGGANNGGEGQGGNGANQGDPGNQGNQGDPGNGGPDPGGYEPRDPGDPSFFDDGAGSEFNDDEPMDEPAGGEYGGRGDADGFSIGYRDAQSGDWVVGPEGDDYVEVITAGGTKDGSN